MITCALEEREEVLDAIVRGQAPIDEGRQDKCRFSQLLEDLSFRGHAGVISCRPSDDVERTNIRDLLSNRRGPYDGHVNSVAHVRDSIVTCASYNVAYVIGKRRSAQ